MNREVARAIRDLLKMNSLGIKISCFPVLPVAYVTCSSFLNLQNYNVMVFSLFLSWSEMLSKMVYYYKIRII